MSTREHIHWEEGLFLQPHHLQFMQRRILEDVREERARFCPYPYGVIESVISRDELANSLVRFDRLRVIMRRSGIVIDVPGNTDLPPLDISKALQSSGRPIMISLGVPLWYPTRGNAIEGAVPQDGTINRLYRIGEVESADENTGENLQALRVRRINARLLLEGDDETDLDVLPLIRIAHGVGEDIGLPRQDPTFVPPCLELRGSIVLKNLARDLANAVDATRRELVIQMSRGGFSVESMRGIQFEQMLRLRTLSRYGAVLPHLVDADGTTPFQLYIELRGLLAELAALRPDRDQFDVVDYDHDAPYIAFSELASRIRAMLRGGPAPSFIRLAFNHVGRLFEAELTDEHLTRPTEYFLAIKVKEDPVALARLVEDQDKFKLMPKSIAGRAIRGIRLQDERHPPLQLPSEANLHYFRLIVADNPRMWERIKEERSITAQWPGSDVSDAVLTLLMPVADMESGA